jgi:hypothetical protein
MTAKQRAARAKFKAVVKEASKLRKKNPKLTQAQAVKQAWAISYSKKRSKVGAAPKKKAAKKAAPTKVKATKSKRTSEMHTDTKSHNVNIRVISGIDQYKQMQFVLDDIKFLSKRIAEYQKTIDAINKISASKRDKFERKALNDAKIRIKNLKVALSNAKKNIKF